MQIYQKLIKLFIRPSPNSTYNCFNTKGIKHLTRLRLSLSHLRYHKFKRRFLDALNRICSGRFGIETTSHFSLHCQNFENEKSFHLNNVSGLTKEKLPSCDISDIKLVLYGDDSLDLLTNTLILNASFDFILSSKRIDGPFYRIIIYVVNNTLKKLQLKHFFYFSRIIYIFYFLIFIFSPGICMIWY